MNKTTVQEVDDRTNKIKTQEAIYPFQMKGIVVKYGDIVPNELKERVPVGKLVAFMPQHLHICEFNIDTNFLYPSFKPEKYFTVKIPVSQLERIYKVNKYVEM